MVPLERRCSTGSRLHGDNAVVVLIAFVFGVIGGGGAAWWWNDRSPEEAEAPSPPAAAGTDVRLVLSGVVAPTQPNDRNGTVGDDPLRIDGALLHSRGLRHRDGHEDPSTRRKPRDSSSRVTGQTLRQPVLRADPP